MLRVMRVAVLFLCVSGFATQTQDVTYDAFIKLEMDQKRSTFAALTPANKAMLKRTHAQQWLEAHRSQLTSGQIAVVQEAIAFLSPDLYKSPADPTLRKKETDLRTKLTCALGRERVQEAFTFLGAVDQQTWIGVADDWLSWFSECVLK